MKELLIEQIKKGKNNSVIFGRRNLDLVIPDEIEKELAKGRTVVVFDFENVFVGLCKKFDYKRYNLSDITKINPFYFEEEYMEHFTLYGICVVDWLGVLINRILKNKERYLVSSYLKMVYQSSYQSETAQPTLRDFVEFLQQNHPVEPLISELLPFVPLFSTHHPSILLEPGLHVFSFSEVPADMLTSYLFSALLVVFQKRNAYSSCFSLFYENVEPFFVHENLTSFAHKFMKGS